MKDIINFISSLPDVILSHEEWDVVNKYIPKLSTCPREKICFEFHKLLTEETEFTFAPHRLEKFDQYIVCWFDLTERLTLFQYEITALWNSLFLRPLAADDLLPLTIYLLPDDKTILEELRYQLGTAMMIDYTSSRGYVITNINGAVSAKLDLINDGEALEKMISHKDYERIVKLAEHLHEAKDTLKNYEKITQLTKYCRDYKIQLGTQIKNLILTHYKEEHEKFFSNPAIPEEETDKAIWEIIRLNYKLSPKLITHDKLLLLLEKFSCIYDLLQTCIRQDVNATHKLNEFGEKYRLHKETLEKNNDDATTKTIKILSGFVILEQLYTLLPKSIRSPSTAEQFHEQTESFANKPPSLFGGLQRNKSVVTTVTGGHLVMK